MQFRKTSCFQLLFDSVAIASDERKEFDTVPVPSGIVLPVLERLPEGEVVYHGIPLNTRGTFISLLHDRLMNMRHIEATVTLY